MKNLLLSFLLILASLIVRESKSTAITPFGKSYRPADTTIKIAWREEVYDPNLKQLVNSLVLNESYFSGISGPEKAALGYLATFIGNECRQDGENVTCKILSALNMDYQCSDANKEFLKKWFASEPSVVEEIENCKSQLTPASATSTFHKITVVTKGDIIKVKFTVIHAYVKDNKLETWNEEMKFGVLDEKLTLIKHTKKKK